MFRFTVPVLSEGSLICRSVGQRRRAGQLIAEFTLTSAYRVIIPKLDVYGVQEQMCTRRGTSAVH